MATGIVRGLIGSVSVTSREGITRELRIGDTVEMNDTVQAASGSTVHIAFDNGNFATVGSNEKLVLDASVIDPMAESDNKTATDQNVADIQAMIAAGADPTEIAEATAAGGDSGTRGDPDHSGSHSFVVVDQAAARGEVTPGFETGTFSSPVPETENDDGRIDTFLADHDTDANPDSPDVLSPAPDIPPSNSNPVITDEGQGLLVKESGVGTTDQGGKPGWAIGDHNHAIAGKPVDEGSFKVTDADGDTLTATLLDKNGVPVKGVVTDDSGTMTVQTEYGTLTVTPTEGADGSVTYTYHYELDNTLADSLNEGDDPVQEHFQIEVSDGHGGTVTQPVDITIEGTNDAPTFNGHGQNIQLKEEGVYNGNHETTDDHKDNGFVFEQNDRPKVQGDLSTYVTDADKGADLTYTVDHFNVKNSAADSVETTLYTANNTAVIDETTGKPVQITVEMVGTPTIDASGIQTIHTNYGTLTVDTKTGHYTFELGGSEEADKLVNSMAAGEKFTFQFETLVTDQFGAIGKHVLSVVIEGANDIPTLTVDKLVLDVTEQGENVSPEYASTDSGHAQGTDIDRGADLHYSLIDENGRETTIIKTDYGTLTIDADGKYHFTIDNTSDAVKALGEGDTRSAGPFTIRVTDEHGAYTEQEIEVNVHGAKDAPVISDHLVVNEHGLDNASDASETAAIKAPDGYRIIDAENGQHGTVSQDADGNWHYTLSGAIDSGNHPGTNTVTGADTVNMTVEDANGNRFTIDVKVDIVDDVPTISNPDTIEGSVTAGHESSDHGKLDFDFGADNGDGKQLTVSIGGHTVDITDIATKGSYDIAGELGTLTIYADGTYHYKANPNMSPGQDSFDVTIRDADGDMAETKIDVNVDAASGPDGSLISHITVNEHGLDHVSDASETASIKAPDGYKIIDAEDGEHGTVSQDADGNWHYTLSGAIDSGNHPGTNTVTGADTVNMTVEDGNGNRFTVDVKVDIVDDVPVIDLGGHGYQDIHVSSGATLHEAAGSIHYDFGADDGKGKSLSVSVGDRTIDATGILENGSQTIQGEFGKLTIHADGSYSYQANPNIFGQSQDSFVITIRDADGDSQSVKLDISVDSPSGPDAGSIDHVMVDEAGLNDANNTSEISSPVTMPDGYTIVDVAKNGQGTYGSIEKGSDGQWHYTLNKAVTSGYENDGTNLVYDADTVKMIVQDTYGNQFTVDVKVDIFDDVPVIDLGGHGYQNIHVDSGSTIHEVAGSIHYDFGADDGKGKSLTVSIGERIVDASGILENGSQTIQGEFGKLTIHADGSYSYQANPNTGAIGQDSFEITITDADGDSQSVKLDVSVDSPSGPDAGSIAHVTVDEAGLNDANNTSEISKPVMMPDGYTIVGSDTGYHGNHGTLAIGSDGNWHYILNEAIDSGKEQGTNTVEGADTVKVSVQDANGNQFTVDVKVDIVDDVPTVNTAFAEAMQDMVNASDGVDHFAAGFEFDFGADQGEGKTVEVSIDGQTVSPHHTEGTVGGTHQTLSSLEVNEKTGEVSYEQTSEAVRTEFGTQGQAHDITVSVTDSDGDVVSQTVHLETVGIQVGGVHSDTITGGNGADIIIGDKGHIDGSQTQVTYNLSLVLDVSNSMYAELDNGNTRLASSVEALNNLIDSIASQATQGGMTVNIQLIGFHSSAFENSWLSVTQDNVNELKSYVNELASHIQDGGASSTNYEAAFQDMYQWFAEQSAVPPAPGSEVFNKVYFISDGVANSITVSGATERIDSWTDRGGETYHIPADYQRGDVVTYQDEWTHETRTLIDKDGNYYGYTESFAWGKLGQIFHYSPDYTDGLGITRTIPTDYVMGQTVTDPQGRVLIDASGHYYGSDKDGNWTIQGDITHKTVNYNDLFNQPDWPANWPHNSYAPDYYLYAQQYVLSHTNSYGKLLDLIPDLEMNSAGFAGSGLNKDVLDQFDNTDGSQILHNGDDLTEFLNPGDVIPPVDADRDTVFSGAGNDIVFGDHVHYVTTDGTELDGDSALLAAISAAGGDIGSNASIHQFLMAHPEFADTLADPGMASSQNDLLIGGTGHDILVGQGGNDLLIGDGDNSLTHDGSLDHLHDLLGTHAQGDDLAAGIHHLFDHGTAQEIHDFTHGIENLNVENSHDGNDHLYGGTGDDILIGMGGNDHLYGGEGHDILLGGSGNDVLVGGKGDDILSGGTGNDIFKYMTGDLDGVTHGDTITDFHLGNLNESNGQLDANADVLDISELISGHDKPTSLESLVNGGYLSFDDVSENADGTLTVKLSIDVDGKDGGDNMTNLATITMTGFEHHTGTDIVQDLMDQLVHNQNIKF